VQTPALESDGFFSGHDPTAAGNPSSDAAPPSPLYSPCYICDMPSKTRTKMSEPNPVHVAWESLEPDLARDVARLRHVLDVPQDEWAEMLDVARETVARWETGAVRPPASSLRLLGEIFVDCVSDQYDEAAPGIAAARYPGDRKSIYRFIAEAPKNFRARLDVWATVWTGRGGACLNRNQWSDVLLISPDILRDAPTAQGSDVWGHDVGLAISAATKGKSYQELIGIFPPDVAATEGERRLMSELFYCLEWLTMPSFSRAVEALYAKTPRRVSANVKRR
jgi:DNA-binding transcriptional regulator YiaG